MTLEARTTRITIAPPGEPLFSERATVVEIQDEAGGEFVVISQDMPSHGWTGKLAFEPNEWPVIRDAIDRMIADCREDRDE